MVPVWALDPGPPLSCVTGQIVKLLELLFSRVKAGRMPVLNGVVGYPDNPTSALMHQPPSC